MKLINAVFILAVTSLILSLAVLVTTPRNHPLDNSALLLVVVNGYEIPVPPEINGEKVKTLNSGVLKFAQGTTLGDFFEEWGAIFSRKCVFQYCNEDTKMFVNGMENFDFDSYQLSNGDEILIIVKTF